MLIGFFFSSFDIWLNIEVGGTVLRGTSQMSILSNIYTNDDTVEHTIYVYSMFLEVRANYTHPRRAIPSTSFCVVRTCVPFVFYNLDLLASPRVILNSNKRIHFYPCLLLDRSMLAAVWIRR